MTSPASAVPVRILGVDPGTRLAGYAVVEVRAAGVLTYVECGTLKVDPRRELNARLLELSEALAEVITEFHPAMMAIESAYTGVSAQSALKLSEARGAFKVVAMRSGLDVFEYAPGRIKRAVVGKGRATKAEVQRRVATLCALTKAPAADAADALAIALCHAFSLRSPRP